MRAFIRFSILMAWLGVIALGLLAGGCGRKALPPGERTPTEISMSEELSEDMAITMERQASYGEGAAFRLLIEADGTVSWQGVKNVSKPGWHQWRIAPDRIAGIRAEFQGVKFPELAQEFTEPAPVGRPTTIISYYENGETLTTHRDHGDPFAPMRMKVLEETILDLSGAGEYL
ncbi:MAG: DUF6438 domain-containing protein [Sumerlaeia bacterium]